MKAVEFVEGNLQNIFGVINAEKQYKKYARCVADKHLRNNILHVTLW
ncbi:MAG TPA: hypothetical protein VJ571_02615 [Candidatus Nitrosotalea sp.]|nr:hypothetical protein [Candidatus Nitrosotalea sp.]